MYLVKNNAAKIKFHTSPPVRKGKRHTALAVSCSWWILSGGRGWGYPCPDPGQGAALFDYRPRTKYDWRLHFQFVCLSTRGCGNWVYTPIHWSLVSGPRSFTGGGEWIPQSGPLPYGQDQDRGTPSQSPSLPSPATFKFLQCIKEFSSDIQIFQQEVWLYYVHCWKYVITRFPT